MELKDITIHNFRGIQELNIPLDDLTVLIGENNIGKSTILEALNLILSRGFGNRNSLRFTEYDFYLKDQLASPFTADPIRILLHFAEEKEGEWPDVIVQQLDDVVQIDSDGINHIWLQATGNYHEVTTVFETHWDFLNQAGDKLHLKNNLHNILLKFIPIFYISALRNASQEFGQRGQFWNSFLKTVTLPENELKAIEEKLQEVNTSVINANTNLAEVIKKISETKRFVSLADKDPVVLEAVPTRIFDLAGKILVHLRSQQGAKLPLYRHGEGTQNLAVLMLFQAFTALTLSEIYAPESTPLLTMEEPEAHLHPTAIRSMGILLQELAGQKIITSHSGDLISRVPITSLRRLYKHQGKIKVGHVGNDLLDAREQQDIDYHIRMNKGHYLFSKCWLLVEGQSDFYIIQRLFEYLGYSPDEYSLSILEMSQVYQKGEAFFKIANALGIQWFLMVDGDTAGKDYARRIEPYLLKDETLPDRANCWQNGTIEREFWFNGFKSFIEGKVSESSRRDIINNAGEDEDKIVNGIIKSAITSCGRKPGFAETIFAEISSRGRESIPQSIKDVISRVISLCKEVPYV